MLSNPNNAQNTSFMCFDELVRDICLYLGDEPAKHYITVSRFAIQAIRAVNLSFIPSVKSIVLTVGQNMATLAPQDLDIISKVAVCCHNGELKVILNNDNLCLPESEKVDCCDCPPKNNLHSASPQACNGASNKESSCNKCTFHNVHFYENGEHQFSSNYWYGYSPKNNNGWYRHDVGSGQIIFGSGCDVQNGSKIILEYKSSSSISELQLIPRKAYQSICHYVSWKIKMANQTNVAELERVNFMRENSVLKSTYQNYTLEDIIYALRSGYQSTVKR
jgi:hypothetical protein